MRVAQVIAVLFLWMQTAAAQDSITVANHTYYLVGGKLQLPTVEHPKVVLLNTYQQPCQPRALVVSNELPIYSYHQGRLPIFCAIEDRIWRKTKIDMRFRITDKPLGNR